MEEGVLARLDPHVLHAYITNRADYKTARLETLFHGVLNAEKLQQQQQQMQQQGAMMQSAWENIENAMDAVGERFEEVGDQLKKMILSSDSPNKDRKS